MKFKWPKFNMDIEETVTAILHAQTGDIVATVMNEVAGSNMALEIKEMITEELEPLIKSMAKQVISEYMDQVKDELIEMASKRLIELLADRLLGKDEA